MKRTIYLIIFLALLSILSGYLLSKATLIGRIGINLFYQEYKILKVWWQGALVIFGALMLLVLIHYIVQKKLDRKTAKFTYLLALAVALVGLYFTYRDFRQSFNHRLLGERFHLGAYLFWAGWMAVTLFYLIQQQKEETSLKNNSGVVP